MLKLLAIGKTTPDDGIEVRVHPTYIKSGHPLASEKDSYNAVYITGRLCRGRHALRPRRGRAPHCQRDRGRRHSTARPIPRSGIPRSQTPKRQTPSVKFIDNFKSAYYLRLNAHDKAGVLAKVSSIFSRHNISLAQMIQEDGGDETCVPLVFITHRTKEKSIMKAVGGHQLHGRHCRSRFGIRVVS